MYNFCSMKKQNMLKMMVVAKNQAWLVIEKIIDTAISWSLYEADAG